MIRVAFRSRWWDALRRSDDTGSLPVALLVSFVGVLLSSLMVASVLTQMGGTRVSTTRGQALSAAQAGLDVALGHIRTATDGAGAGVISLLPCTVSGPVNGTGGGDDAQYQATVAYYASDPQGRPEAWLRTQRIPCLPGGGTRGAPAYALIESVGRDGTGGGSSTRTLVATYTFQTIEKNIAGGLIHVFKTATSRDLCLDAGSGAPAPGTDLRVQACTAGSAQQTFAYNSTLTITLVASRTATRPLGLCLDAGSPHQSGQIVRLQPCTETTAPQQQWSINDSANFEGTSNGSTLDGYCFNVQNPNTPGSLVILRNGSNCRGSYNTTQTFSPEAPVGAGAAGEKIGQLVNLRQFGRCLDVTGQNTGAAYLIAWPCKQAPNPANVAWNQKWTLPSIPENAEKSAEDRITTRPSAGLYCLQSPLSTASGRYVRIVTCPGNNGKPPELRWTVYGKTDSYATSYRIVDSAGYCLSPTDPDATPADLHGEGQQVSKLVVARCDGSTLQKWNAPPNVLQTTPLKDIGEK